MNKAFFLTFTLAAFLLITPFAQAQEWWDSSYIYRKQITITNNHPTDTLPSGYTVSLTLDTTGSKFLDNGDDVRIIFDDTVELDRITSTSFDSTSTEILFQTQESILATDIADKYYVYYGNPSALNPPSNKDSVYFFQDDFTDVDGSLPDPTKWTSVGNVKIQNNSLEIIGVSGWGSSYLITNQIFDRSGPSGFYMETTVKKTVLSAAGTALHYGNMVTPPHDGLLTNPHDDSTNIKEDNVHVKTGPLAIGEFESRFWLYGKNQGNRVDLLKDEQPLIDWQNPTWQGNNMKLSIQEVTVGQKFVVDNVIVRKLINPEPSLDSGIEEVILPVIIDSPLNISYSTDVISVEVATIPLVSIFPLQWSYSLNQGPEIEFTPNITITALPGSNNLSVAALLSDGSKPSTSVLFTVNLNPPTLSDLPDLIAAEDDGLLDDQFYLPDFATDVELEPEQLTYNVVEQSDPSIVDCEVDSGLFIDCTTQQDQHGSSTVTVEVDDGNYQVTDSFLVTVTSVADPPDIAPFESIFIQEGEFLSVQPNTTDPDGDNLTFSTDASNVLPSPFDFDNSTGLFEWTPGFLDAGNYSVTFTVTDGFFFDSEVLQIEVNETTDPPDLQNPGDQTVTEGEVLSIQLLASDPDGDNLTFSTDATSSLPSSAFTIDEDTGVFTWTPDFIDYGTHSLTFIVSDGLAQDSETIEITVLDADTATISYVGSPTIGNTVTFLLSDPAAKKQFYIMGASLSTSPGTPLGDGRTVPLTSDFVFDLSVYFPSMVGLTDSVGTLNTVGNGLAMWTVPDYDYLVGQTVYFSFITLDLSLSMPMSVISISQPVALTISEF